MTYQKNFSSYLVFIFSLCCFFYSYILSAQVGEEGGCEIDLFNERGFLKGNTYTSEASGECISDFNGNLTYTKSLLYFPGRGDLDLNLTLTYNGSVNHTIQYTLGNQIVTMNFPECILGVNGVAIQVFNFKQYWYQEAAHPTIPAYLVEGYDKSNPLKLSNWNLSFLMSDGSIEEYISSDVPSHCYWGKYISTQVENFSVAWQQHTPQNCNQVFKIRRKNGIVITYVERTPDFSDRPDTITFPDWDNRLPHTYYPISIEDRFGNSIIFKYDTTYALPQNGWGRWRIKRIIDACGRVIDINLHGVTNLSLYCDIKPNTYTGSGDWQISIELKEDTNYGGGDNDMCYLVKEIVEKTDDSQSRITTFDYETYVRRIKSINPSYLNQQYRVWARRLKKITHSTGDTTKFSYIEADDTLQIWEHLTADTTNYWSNTFKSTGREPFLANMVDTMIKKNSAGNIERKVSYSYTWTGQTTGYEPRNDVSYEYYTVKKDSGTVGLRPEGEWYTLSRKDSLYFRKYPVKDHSIPDPYLQHYLWHTKIFRTVNKDLWHWKGYYWDADFVQAGGYYEGTFLPDSIRRTRGANRKFKDSYLYDSYGNVIEHIDPLGNGFRYMYYYLDYTSNGLIDDYYVVDKVKRERILFGEIYKVVSEYDYVFTKGDRSHSHLRLIWRKEMIDDNTYAKTYYDEYDDYGNCRKITDPKGNITEFSYDDIFEDGEWYYSGNHGFWTKKRIVYTPIKFFNDHGDSTKPGLLIKSRDPNGQITRYTEYDWWGRIKKIKRPDDSSPSIKFFYNDEAGNKSSEIWRYFDSSDKYSTLYRFDDFDRLYQKNIINTSAYDTLSTEYTHTFMDKTASGTSPKGTKTLTFDYDYTKYYKYDAIGRLKEVIQPFEVHPTGEGMRGYSGTDKLKTLYNYSILNSNFSYTIDGHTVTLMYAEKTTITDARGKKKNFIYDAKGQLRAVREIIGSDTLTTYYDYYPRGLLTAIKDAKGREVTFTYDLRGNLIERNHFDLDNPETFSYNKNAMLTKKTKPDSMAIRYEYDRINRATKVKYGGGGETSIIDDFEGTFNWNSIPSGKCQKSFDDSYQGTYSMKVTFEWEHPTTATRDDSWNWSAYDSLFLYYKFLYDTLPGDSARFFSVYVKDGSGHSVSIQSIRQVNTAWHRLALNLNAGNLDKSDIDKIEVKFNASPSKSGKGITESIKDGRALYHGYIDYICVKPGGPTKATYKYDSYDANVNPPTDLNYPKNHLTKMTDESGWTMYFYDKRGRLGEKWVNFDFDGIDDDTFKVHYNYNKADQITSITYPGDVIVGYQYDEFGRTKKVSGLSTTLATIIYDPNSRDSIINYGNGVESKFFYYPTEWVKSTNTSHEELGTFINNSYGYDSTGNRISENSGLSATYKYDDLNRLIQEYHIPGPWTPTDYTYDAVGNRDSVNLVNYIYYPGTDRLKTVGIITYYYDENGNITGLSSGTSIEYNYRDMPTKITESGGTIYTFSYNGDGLRVKKHRQTGGDSDAQQAPSRENYYFIHDENGNVLCDIDKEGNIKARYIYANGKHIAKKDRNSRVMFYYHLDPLGSPLVITTSSLPPSILKQYKYRAFGELKYESGTYYDNHRFTGKEEDGSGLYYFGARYYDKSLGRWISPDPASMPSNLNLNDPQTLNPYVYCTNNPLKYLDPNGMWRTMVVNNTAYVVRQSKFYATTEFAFTTFGPGVGLVSTAMRATGGDITVGAADWGSGVVGSIPGVGGGLGTVAKMLIGSAKVVGIARGATLISESNVDKIKLAIYSKLTGNPSDPLYNLGEGGTYRYKLGGVEKKQDIINLPNYKDYLLKIEDFWKLMGAAGWDWDKIGDKERYQDIYNAYLEVNKQ